MIVIIGMILSIFFLFIYYNINFIKNKFKRKEKKFSYLDYENKWKESLKKREEELVRSRSLKDIYLEKKRIEDNLIKEELLKKEKKDFNPYKHKKKIEEANNSINRIRKLYFEEKKSHGHIMNELKAINGLIFEEMVLSCLKEAGFRIWRSPTHSGDGGLDGMVFINDVKILLQSKCWKGYINNKHVEEFSNLILKRKAHFGFFVHTGKTGPLSYTKLNNKAHFISGDKVLHLILQPSKSDFNGKSFLVPQLKELLSNKVM